jgi:hypothetical protein
MFSRMFERGSSPEGLRVLGFRMHRVRCFRVWDLGLRVQDTESLESKPLEVMVWSSGCREVDGVKTHHLSPAAPPGSTR